MAVLPIADAQIYDSRGDLRPISDAQSIVIFCDILEPKKLGK